MTVGSNVTTYTYAKTGIEGTFHTSGTSDYVAVVTRWPMWRITLPVCRSSISKISQSRLCQDILVSDNSWP
jgi:hypothetical protein